MKPCDQLTFRPRWRLNVERLEDRNMLGDALSWLLGNLFWPDLLAIEPERLYNLVSGPRDDRSRPEPLGETWNRPTAIRTGGLMTLTWVDRTLSGRNSPGW